MIQKPKHKTTVENYCEQVASGEVVACEAVKKAVNRYYSDLERVNTVDFPYVFSYDQAELACMFFPIALRHSIGEWQRQPFELAAWQAFIHWNVHGWRNRDGSRRFRKVLVSIARKNGKTTYCAGSSIQSATCDINPQTGMPESVAQVFIGATKINQAKIMFDETARMVKQSPSISKACEITQQSLFFPGTQSTIAPLASDRPFSGLGPSAMIFDEMHEFTERHRKFYDTMTTGSASRVQPLQWIITTASDDKGLIYHEEFNYARSVLDGTIKDESLFAIIFELDKDDDIFDESTWVKANPNLGVSVKLEYLRDQAAEAKNKPSKRSPFERFHCNRCVKSVEQSARPPQAELANWEDADAIGYGVDMGGMDDLASIGIVARFIADVNRDDDDNETPVYRYEARSLSYMSAHSRRDLSVQPWTNWIASGRLVISEYIYSQIARDLREDMEFTRSQHFAYDPQFTGQLAEEAENLGLVPIKTPQRHYSFNEPLLEFYSAISEDRFIVDIRDEILDWSFGNMAINRDTIGRMMPDKKSSRDKIDPSVATIMALKAAMAIPPRFTGSLFLG